MERDLQDALRRNIHQLDPTLRIVDHGKERRVEAGFIDILAEDDQDSLVVIELKTGEAPETAVTQLLSYIGSLHTEGSQPVRGILIARGFPKRVRLAARAAGIQLAAYGFSFSFTTVETATDALGQSSKPRRCSLGVRRCQHDPLGPQGRALRRTRLGARQASDFGGALETSTGSQSSGTSAGVGSAAR